MDGWAVTGDDLLLQRNAERQEKTDLFMAIFCGHEIFPPIFTMS